jgi:hypothetical protein
LCIGTVDQLLGGYAAATAVATEFKRINPAGGYGYAYHLDILLSQLSREDSQKTFNLLNMENATTLLGTCEASIKLDENSVQACQYCRNANFVLAFLNGLRGHYYWADINDGQTIKHFNHDLSMEPGLTKSRLHFGITFHYADHLPPLIRLFSRHLRFIPTGDPVKCLVYIRQTVAADDYLKGPAMFASSDLMRNKGEVQQHLALTQLLAPIAEYPKKNPIPVDSDIAVGRNDAV